MTQHEMIMEYLYDRGSITQMEACSELGCYRLAARISDLRKRGVKIKKTTETSKNRYGCKVTYARYTLEE